MQRIRSILNSQLFRIGSLNSISVALKIAIGLVTSKVIAVFVGPGGMALVGNLRNFMSSIETVSTLGFQNGIIKYVAENEKQTEKLKRVLSTVFFSLLIVTILLSSGLFFFSGYWNFEIFGFGKSYDFIFRALAFALPWYASSLVLIAVLNGLGKFREVIYTTIFGNITGLAVSVFLIWKYALTGALLAVALTPALVFFMSFYLVNKNLPLRFHINLGSFDKKTLHNLSSYSMMALVSAVISPLVFLAVRNHIIDMIGAEQAGYWEAITRISTYYLMFISTVLGVYFLPKLSATANNSESRKVLGSYYKNVLPVFAFALLFLFIIKDFVIKLIFTDEFLPVKSLFFWQLAGDILKAASLILGYLLVAKKRTFAFIMTEFLSMGIMFFASRYFVNIYGIEGVVIAHFTTYTVYLIVLSIYFRKLLFRKSES